MKKILLGTAAVIGTAVTAQAGGLDRSGQDIGIIFESGNRLELSYGNARPDLTGRDFLGNNVDNVAKSFGNTSAGLRYELSPKVSVAVVVDEPYGSDIVYEGNPASTMLGGTTATVDSFAVTALARYKFNDSFSLHGGMRYQELSASVDLRGLAYGGLSGYRAEFDKDGAVGFVVGAAFERPEIGMRVALTYNSKITHDLATRESMNGTLISQGTTEIVTPETLNLEAQTGIAADTLLFGSIRYARHEDTQVSPTLFDASVDPTVSGSSITDIENTTDIEIGIGRRFSDKFAAQVAIGYLASSSDSLVSPLTPTNGSRYISVGGSYTLNESVTLSGGIRYTKFGDAYAETGTPDVARAQFNDNSAVSAGFKVAYTF
ncbi:long-subunit fatty acid transport protein [Sulfitobacter undariae]|uniref:Long-subunit fatty acid transport protein n=1 Tax=Sulfitobacter undariae TaxID=1563671 RepID=A0A7W6H032_9RHOB|nr:hypothetical protein [Sulfitobacter undariae]MBB3994531.1 long-subunit fatty acid transport protein [Sulfitobacter undariae]